MDKENLYYVVEKGTNVRDINLSKDFWVGNKEKALENAAYTSRISGKEYVPIKIKEYEQTYMEKAT